MAETVSSLGTTSTSCCTDHCRAECAPTITDLAPEKAKVPTKIIIICVLYSNLKI